MSLGPMRAGAWRSGHLVGAGVEGSSHCGRHQSREEAGAVSQTQAEASWRGAQKVASIGGPPGAESGPGASWGNKEWALTSTMK